MDQIFTQYNLWKLLYLVVKLDFFVPHTDLAISFMAHEHCSDVCENKKKNEYILYHSNKKEIIRERPFLPSP